jgi:hypothetical protein
MKACPDVQSYGKIAQLPLCSRLASRQRNQRMNNPAPPTRTCPYSKKAGLLVADELSLLRILLIQIARYHDKWMWFL